MSATRRAPTERIGLQLVIQLGSGVRESPASRAQLRRWIGAVLSRPAALTLRFVNRAEAQRLNSDYRRRGYAPDVLTFDYSSPDAPLVEADIVICLPVAREQARRAGRSAHERLAHLVMHGVLHAQGLDHEDEREAREMEAREVEVLRRFRIADPYR
jgi:probable rRNA maturation factor